MSVSVNQHRTIKTVQRRLISVHYAVAVEMNSVVAHAVPTATHLNVVCITLIIKINFLKQTNQFAEQENTQRVQTYAEADYNNNK